MRWIAAGDRVEAISFYISITECGLTEAQDYMKALSHEAKAAKLENPASKPPGKKWFGIF